MQTRDQWLSVTLLKSIKLQLTRNLELIHFLKPKYIPAEMHQKPFFSQRENRPIPLTLWRSTIAVNQTVWVICDLPTKYNSCKAAALKLA